MSQLFPTPLLSWNAVIDGARSWTFLAVTYSPSEQECFPRVKTFDFERRRERKDVASSGTHQAWYNYTSRTGSQLLELMGSGRMFQWRRLVPRHTCILLVTFLKTPCLFADHWRCCRCKYVRCSGIRREYKCESEGCSESCYYSNSFAHILDFVKDSNWYNW